MCPRGDLNTKSGAISPDRGIHTGYDTPPVPVLPGSPGTVLRFSLPVAEGGGWLPDGSRATWLNGPSGKKADRLPVRAAEHNIVLPRGDGEEVSETCTLITTLSDHRAAPASAVREVYLARWSASETTFGENKSTIAGAGNRTSGPVLRSGSSRKPGPG
jgi:hypothetical protein